MGGRRPRGKGEPGEQHRPRWLATTDHALLLCGAAAVIGLTYLMFQVVSGALAAPLIAGSWLELLKQRVEVARQVFLWAGWIAVLGVMARQYRTESVGYLVLVGGVLCWLLLPWTVRNHVAPTSAPELVQVAWGLVVTFQTTGALLMVLGFGRAVIGRAVLAWRAPTARPAAPPTGGRPSLMRKCWELQFCRPSLRVYCPRYREQTTCWKRGSGCHCDEGLATRVLSAARAQAEVQTAGMAYTGRTGGYDRDRTPSPAAAIRASRAKGTQKAPCGSCPLYLEHQQSKYRVLSWFAYPAAVAIVGALLPQIRHGYAWLDSYLSRTLSVPLPIHYAPVQGAEWLSAENAAIVLVAVLAAAAILQLMELAVFRLKL